MPPDLVGPPAAPQLCFGQVRHRRLRPVRHGFQYGIYFIRLPLRTLGQQDFGCRLFARNRFNLLSFHDADHGDGRQPLLRWIDGLLAAEGVRDADGEGWLQTMPRVLEIGCGWGGFAETAAREAQAHVTGLTLSTEQLGYATQRLAGAGLAASADLRLCDYRDCEGQFDAIASIEMFEAVGESYWPGYFACVARNLKQGGRACIQTITIDDGLFERYRKGTDFIQQYIFPGGMLPSPSEFRRQAGLHGLRVVDEFRFGIDYADTLRHWRASFLARRAEVEGQGFDQRFMLTWEFYLAYCEAAFRAGNTDVMQFTLVKD